jgi:hypothetical protein
MKYTISIRFCCLIVGLLAVGLSNSAFAPQGRLATSVAGANAMLQIAQRDNHDAIVAPNTPRGTITDRTGVVRPPAGSTVIEVNPYNDKPDLKSGHEPHLGNSPQGDIRICVEHPTLPQCRDI